MVKGPLFLSEFELALKQLGKKGNGLKKKGLSRRMADNPLFYMDSKKIHGLCPSDERSLILLSKRLKAFI
jgi:hypothetical protein